MKRYIIRNLILCALLLCICTVTVFAANPVITVDVPDNQNGTFNVTVSIAQNPGINGFQMELVYDHSVYECTAIQSGAVTQNLISASNVENGRFICTNAGMGSAASADGVLVVYTLRPLGSQSSEIKVTGMVLAGADNAETEFTLSGCKSAEETEETESDAEGTEQETDADTEETEEEKETDAEADGEAETETDSETEENTVTNPFVDVRKNSYYYDAVLWAKAKNITGGIDN